MPELPEVETALRGISPYLKSFIIEKLLFASQNYAGQFHLN
ncbi:formamidopyrimidine-DNA glycosylase [Rodentibacter pneumotropicus]|uniref:Formamidopyrimidine-DNA glycosylase n=1 Tax=Rodentibacter pneumotropicus TaxID=758 RepID=A0A448MSU2_9PAST|nr:formamidopyrimidine-DNA glycosylase [Rodentibacter pneumotropicus]